MRDLNPQCGLRKIVQRKETAAVKLLLKNLDNKHFPQANLMEDGVQ